MKINKKHWGSLLGLLLLVTGIFSLNATTILAQQRNQQTSAEEEKKEANQEEPQQVENKNKEQTSEQEEKQEDPNDKTPSSGETSSGNEATSSQENGEAKEEERDDAPDEVTFDLEKEQDKKESNRLLNMQYEHFSLRPYLKQDIQFDNNIFRLDNDQLDDETDDFLMLHTTAGVSASFKQGPFRVSGKAQAVGKEFRDLDSEEGEIQDIQDILDDDDREESEDSDYSGRINARYNFSDHVYVSARHSASETNSPLLLDSISSTQESFITSFNRDTEAKVGFKSYPWKGSTKFGYSTYDVSASQFEDLEYEDRQNVSLIQYTIDDRITLRLRSVYGEKDFEEGRENQYFELTPGVQWDPLESLGVIFDVGPRSDQYSDDGPGGDDFTGGTFSTTARWRPLETSTISLQLKRHTKDSTFSNFVVREEGILKYKQEFTDWFSTKTSLLLAEEEEASSDVQESEKEFFNVYVKAIFGMTDWSDLSIAFRRLGKSTNDGQNEYVAEISTFMIEVRF